MVIYHDLFRVRGPPLFIRIMYSLKYRFTHGEWYLVWASCQIRKIAGCACTGNARNDFPASGVSNPDMHHSTCIPHVPWCIPESLTSGVLWSRWWGKRSRHSQRMRNPQFYVSGKTPMWYMMRYSMYVVYTNWYYMARCGMLPKTIVQQHVEHISCVITNCGQLQWAIPSLFSIAL